MKTQEKCALGYLRTSSATNVGPDKDSELRQREAIETFASRAGYTVVEWFYDAAVSGADPIEARPGFASMLERIASNGIRSIIVETANRFARDLMVQEVGYAKLKGLGIELIAADSPNSFTDDTPTAILIRQILGSVAQFDKTMTVSKLKAARDRKIAQGLKCGGRDNHAQARPDAVQMAKDLHKQGLSLRGIAKAVYLQGFFNDHGRPFHPSSIASMLLLPQCSTDQSNSYQQSIKYQSTINLKPR